MEWNPQYGANFNGYQGQFGLSSWGDNALNYDASFDFMNSNFHASYDHQCYSHPSNGHISNYDATYDYLNSNSHASSYQYSPHPNLCPNGLPYESAMYELHPSPQFDLHDYSQSPSSNYGKDDLINDLKELMASVNEFMHEDMTGISAEHAQLRNSLDALSVKVAQMIDSQPLAVYQMNSIQQSCDQQVICANSNDDECLEDVVLVENGDNLTLIDGDNQNKESVGVLDEPVMEGDETKSETMPVEPIVSKPHFSLSRRHDLFPSFPVLCLPSYLKRPPMEDTIGQLDIAPVLPLTSPLPTTQPQERYCSFSTNSNSFFSYFIFSPVSPNIFFVMEKQVFRVVYQMLIDMFARAFDKLLRALTCSLF